MARTLGHLPEGTQLDCGPTPRAGITRRIARVLNQTCAHIGGKSSTPGATALKHIARIAVVHSTLAQRCHNAPKRVW